MRITINISEHSDESDVQELMEEFDMNGVPDIFGDINFKKLTVFEQDAIKVFIEKFKYVPLEDLEEFLNKYKL